MQMRILFLAALAASLGAADPQPPASPAGRQFSAWLDAFNNNDPAVFRTYLEKNYPSQTNPPGRGFRDQTGGFDFKKTEESSALALTGLVQERKSDQFARFTIEVEADEPYRITRWNLRAIPRPEEFPLPQLSEKDLVAALRTKLEQDAAADQFSGAVLVARNGKPVFSAAYGLADRSKKIANKLGTRFRLGSMNKMFTAVSTLQLVQAGKIRLDAPLGKYLTDYPNKDVASKVTIHHLLTHTGGTGDFFGPQYNAHRKELRGLQDYVTLYGQRGLEFEPGSKWSYSNYGFLLLGLVIEKVSGQSYYDYVREHVYKPAGMSSTDSQPEEETVADRSIGYMRREAGWQPNTDTLPPRPTSAGGGYSTVGDLLRFANALQNRTLLNEHYTEVLTTGKVDTPGLGKYAYGFADRTASGVRSIGHGGGAPGMNGELAIYPQTGYVVVVLANLDPPAATRIADFIGNRLPAK